jgi:serine/threonine-protein kinase
VTRCPTCKREFDQGEQFCPRDGSPLSESPPAGDALVGRVLGGRYRLAERLGQGGMGTVYRGMHTLMDKPLAVKILRGELATDADAVARFHREARSASRLDHDHCIRVTDFGQSEDGLLYLTMELLEGRSLARRMRDGRLPVAEACSIAYAIALALEHAHEAGVIHRDLKPDNVFLAKRSRGREVVKVLDFGLAKLASDSGKSRSITRDGTVFGTPEYMAPEQAQGDPLDARTDLYALGVLLYHMLTGELPFQAETFVALLTKHIREQPRPPRDLVPDLPPALDAIVMKCMAKRADGRFESASALAEALLPFASRTDVTGQVAPLPSAPPHADASGPLTVSRGLDAATSSEMAMLDPRRRARGVVAGIFAVAAVVGVTLGARAIGRSSHATITPNVVAAHSELDDIRQLIEKDRLDEASSELAVLHKKGESAELERVTSEVAERRGRRLEALAHLHRAKTLAPTDARTRNALAHLLFRLGQRVDACHQAARGLELASVSNDTATSADLRGILKEAACSDH